MAYSRKSLQILGGGFNCLPSVDKVPQTDYLLAQNFRVDRLGRLVSRYGYPQVFALTGGGIAHSAASMGGAASPYYVGCNSAIATPTSQLFYDGSSIATGFDGNRIGFASQNHWMWVMNRAVQGRHNAAAGWEPWNLSLPGAIPGNSVTATAVAASAGSASVTYSYTATGVGPTVHTLTISGITYSITEDAFYPALGVLLTSEEICWYLAAYAASDPNCSVTYPGTGTSIVIAPIVQFTGIDVSGSDSNTPTLLALGAISTLPNGTYQYYVTFLSTDMSLESNPGPASNAVVLAGEAASLADIPVSADARVGSRNIYATGGTLNQPYLVGNVPDNTSTTATISMGDLQATNNGVVMPTTNDPPPVAAGIIGPYFGCLIAWSTAAAVNRVFYTNPGLPQYWPGSGNNNEGNWFEAGDEDEAIVWCTVHTNVLVIYKEKSIWMLIGPPSTGTLQQYRDAMGATGQFAVVSAGLVDYFVGAGGLHKFDLNNVTDVDANISPIFQSSLTHTHATATSPPGSVLPGSAYNSNLTTDYAIALGYGMGKLYVGYAEKTSTSVSYGLMVFHEDSSRWFYHRSIGPNTTGWFGFFFDGTAMIGLSGGTGFGEAVGLNLDDFRGFVATDSGAGDAIECVYGSHYENGGLPDNPKMWLEVVVDYECAAQSGTFTVYASFENGAVGALTSLGTPSYGSGGRQSLSLPLDALGVSADGGVLARNMSVTIDAVTAGSFILHNVYLYYYVEARLTDSVSTIPVDLGVGLVKQCKELQLDINTANGAATAVISSDLPGNVLATRETITVGSTAGRGIVKFPFSFQEGFLWQLSLTGTQFQVYAARLLMRVVGTYIEAYEAAAGFVWDSMEMTFDSGVTHIPRGYMMALASWPVKRAREILLEIDTFNQAVTVTLLTDLPGNAQASRFTGAITANGRRFVRIPLPQGTATPIEGRIYRLQISGTHKFILYDAGIDIMPVGVYIEAYEAAGSPNSAVWDSTIIDMGDPSAKTIDEIQIEMDSDTGGNASLALYTDLPGEAQALRGTYQLTSGLTGRAWVTVPVADITGVVEGRSPRLLISSTVGFRLYAARIRYNKIGRYLAAASLSGSDALNTLEYDFASERVKSYKRIEIDLNADGDVTLTVVTSQATTGLSTVYTKTITTTGRQAIMVPLPPGVRGRLLRVSLASASAARIYHVRVLARPLNEQKGGWAWADYPVEESSVVPEWKQIQVAPTPADWFWAKVLSVAETADTWQWVDVPIAEVTE